ncbi:hypothetical protein D3C72_1975250 [compost metagenome]
MVGTSGASAMRSLEVTASSFSLPVCSSGSAAVIWSNMKVTAPDDTSTMAGGVPLYGTCVSGTPIMLENNSPARCVDVPAPDDAKVRLLGSRLSSAIKSATEFTPRFGSTSSTLGR